MGGEACPVADQYSKALYVNKAGVGWVGNGRGGSGGYCMLHLTELDDSEIGRSGCRIGMECHA